MNILVLCTGNSARSILLETQLAHHGKGRVRTYSAGSTPTGRVNPQALSLLQNLGYATDHARSKSWNEFESESAPMMDLVITVCDNAAAEPCPLWPSPDPNRPPIRHHYGIADPAHFSGDEGQIAFQKAYLELMDFTTRFLDLPLETLDRDALQGAISAIEPRLGELA